jgi:hypothetical protein
MAAVAGVSVAVGARCNAQLDGDRQDHLYLGAVQANRLLLQLAGHARGEISTKI